MLAIALALSIGAASGASAQGRRGGAPAGPARPGTVERVSVHGKSLEGNRDGDSPDRDVVIYLPASYSTDAMRRFPAVYLLSGDGGRSGVTLTERLVDEFKVPAAADRLGAAQGFSDAIVVMTDAASAGGGIERFVADDLVSYVDARYRTIATRMSRGLAGHSIGGYRALRLAMQRPELFSSLYVMSACCFSASADSRPDEMPLTSLDGYAANLRRYYAVAIDVGARDAVLDVDRRLHDAMTRLGIPHYYEEHDGDRGDKLSERIETRVLPFFSRNLVAPANPTSPAVKD